VATSILLQPPFPCENSPKSRKPRVIHPAHGTCSLTLKIRGTRYAVKPVRPDLGSGVSKCYSLRKLDGSGALYHVSEHAGWTECTCPDWIFSRDGLSYNGCKHINSMSAFLMIDAGRQGGAR
jgi:hypothetical protein